MAIPTLNTVADTLARSREALRPLGGDVHAVADFDFTDGNNLRNLQIIANVTSDILTKIAHLADDLDMCIDGTIPNAASEPMTSVTSAQAAIARLFAALNRQATATAETAFEVGKAVNDVVTLARITKEDQ